jgi:hypothetical protein
LIPEALAASNDRSESHFRAVELAQFGVMKEDPVYVFIRLFEANLLVAQNFAYENPALVPANISAVVHSPRLE